MYAIKTKPRLAHNWQNQSPLNVGDKKMTLPVKTDS